MARDTEKFEYYTVSVPKHSRVLTLLKQDAEDTGKEIGSLLSMRIADYYLQRNGMIFQTSAAPVVSQPVEAQESTPTPQEAAMSNGKKRAAKSLKEWM